MDNVFCSSRAALVKNGFDEKTSIRFLESADYQSLNIKQQLDVAARLNYYGEIAIKAIEAAAAADSDFLDAVDDIELEAMSIMSLGNGEIQVSPYIIHSSWVFECERQIMAQFVTKDAADFLGSAPLGMRAASKEIKAWISNWSQLLQATLKKFTNSSSFTEAIAQFLVIDAFIFSFLTFCALVRLSGLSKQ